MLFILINITVKYILHIEKKYWNQINFLKHQVHIAVIGNKTDLQEGREVDKEKAAAWAQREKGKTGMLAWKCLGV